MPDQTLPDRLRELAEPASRAAFADARDAMRAAADELERFTRLPEPLEVIEPSDVIYALRYGLEHRDYVGTAHDLEVRREALRLLSGATLAALARLEREAHPLHEIGAELAGDAGVPVPMPQPRRFVAFYADSWVLPAPGSFVQTPPVGAAWRVLAVDTESVVGTYPDRHDGGDRRAVVLELEAVDPHDVPMGARSELVPLPVHEVGPAEVAA